MLYYKLNISISFISIKASSKVIKILYRFNVVITKSMLIIYIKQIKIVLLLV